MALHLQKVGWRVAVEAQSWSLAQVRLLVYCCGLMEMGVLAPLVLAMVEVKRLSKGGQRKEAISQTKGGFTTKWAFGLRNGTRVPRGGFARGPSFRSITPFSQDDSFGCEMFSQGKPRFSQGDSFGCEIFAGE
uniref:Uncharacterized protein n=1 Tax=Vitis vinifera TaxID=29760 RepID=A5C8F8_VITVI|nr:hypothetical protein VITISV_007326 [Vitis vinifera]